MGSLTGRPTCVRLRGRTPEEGVEGLFELFADFFFAAFDEVHGHVRGIAVLELDLGVREFFDFVGGDQAESVDQC